MGEIIAGDTDFGPLRLLCRAPTLIPRPETAHVFARLAAALRAEHDAATPPLDARRPLRILDLCTGSAPIALLLAHELGARLGAVHGVDVRQGALELAAENAALQSPAIESKLHLWRADILAPSFTRDCLARTAGPVDALTANPPYIAPGEYASLPASVRAHEDRAALEAGRGGLAFYERIAEVAPRLVRPSSGRRAGTTGEGEIKLALEIGHAQAAAVRDILERRTGGLVRRTACWADQWGRDRLVVGYG